MTRYARKHRIFRNALVFTILLPSCVSYICIFNLMAAPQATAVDKIEMEQDKKEVSLPEVELMKSVLEKARDVFTIMSRKL